MRALSRLGSETAFSQLLESRTTQVLVSQTRDLRLAHLESLRPGRTRARREL